MPVPVITGVPTAITAFVGGAVDGPSDVPVPVSTVSAFAEIFGAGRSPLAIAVGLFFDNGGSDAVVVRAGTGMPIGDDDVSGPALQSGQRGLWALDKATFNLLCIPPYGPDVGGDISARTRRAATALCRARRAFYIVDPLASWTSVDSVLTGPEGIESDTWGLPRDENAALYVPRLIVADPTAGPPLACAPGGAVAGVIARTDRRRGVWKAPAGTEGELTGATGLSPELTEAEQARLNPAGVNVVRRFPDRGLVVWGARTLRGTQASASEWKYVSVRRLVLFIEGSIDEGTRWAMSEASGPALWTQLRGSVSAFLNGLFRAGAFQGRTEREAYFVKCDAQTTSQEDIDAGRAHVVVGVAPLKPAEFVVLEVTVTTARPDDEG